MHAGVFLVLINLTIRGSLLGSNLVTQFKPTSATST